MTSVLNYRVDDESIDGMLRWNAQYRGTKSAVICGESTLSYAELNTRANRLANALLARGLHKGDRLAVFLPNCVEYLEIYCAAAKAGFVVTPINYMLTAREISYVLDDAHASALIHEAAKTDLIEACALDPESIPTDRVLAVRSGYEAALDDADAGEPPGLSHRDVPFYQGYTSGTTGAPKGCLQLHSAFVEHFKRSLLTYGHRAEDTMLIAGPLFHEAPTLFTLAQLFYGGTVVVLPRFTPGDALAAIEAHGCTMMGFAVPAMLDQMTALDSAHDVSSLKKIICGGAALLNHTIEQTIERFAQAALHEFYGATELGLMTDIIHAPSSKRRTVGRPLPGVALVVLDDRDKPVSPGQIGQIFVSPIMMEGYYGRPEQTAADTRQFGGVSWFTLGDLGFLDEEGFLFIVDRKTHMIITGGENVYPVEVESILVEHPAIRDISVIGLPDERWGETVTAVVVPTDAPPSVQDLRAFAAGRLAAYKLPKRVIAVDELPRTPSGKVLKHVLRTEHANRASES